MSSESTAPPQPKSGTEDWQNYGAHRGRVIYKEAVTPDVSLYIVEKPQGFDFRPGQAIELAIDEVGWRDAKRPFTLTSLPDNPRLQLIIKSYPDRNGVTKQLQREIEVNDRVIFSDPWGAIEYQGPGVFIAGGAGITPFIAIFRELERSGRLKGNRLFFSNRTHRDVILQGELFRLLGRDVVCTLTRETHPDYEHGRVDRDWLTSRINRFDQPFYLCGPPGMVRDLKNTLLDLGASPDALIYEQIADDDGDDSGDD
ncbi:MAG: FAD-binding oxidoreductase [Fuerstiella sp.]